MADKIFLPTVFTTIQNKDALFSAWEKFRFGIVREIDVRRATMTVDIEGSPERRKGTRTNPIRINFPSVGATYGVRQMPKEGQQVLLYITRYGYYHVGSLAPLHESYLFSPSDTNTSGNLQYLAPGEFAVDNNGMHIAVLTKLIRFFISTNLETTYDKTLEQKIDSFIHALQLTENERSSLIFGKILRKISPTNSEAFSYLEDSQTPPENTYGFDEFKRILNLPFTEAGLDTTSDPEYVEHIAPLLISSDRLPIQSKNLKTPENLIYFQKFSHDKGKFAQTAPGGRAAEITTEIGETGSLNKKLTFTVAKDIFVNLDITNKADIKIEVVAAQDKKITLAFDATKGETSLVDGNEHKITLDNQGIKIEEGKSSHKVTLSTQGIKIEDGKNSHTIEMKSNETIIQNTAQMKITMGSSEIEIQQGATSKITMGSSTIDIEQGQSKIEVGTSAVKINGNFEVAI